jgi:ABC-2 type transport system ATP-binding protein
VHALRAAIDELDAVGVPDAHVSIRKPSLDDVFLALTATTASTAPASHDEHELEVSV